MTLNLSATLLRISLDTLGTPHTSADNLISRVAALDTEADYTKYRYLLEFMVHEYHNMFMDASEPLSRQLTIDTLKANHESPHISSLVASRNKHEAYLYKCMDNALYHSANDVYFYYFNEWNATKRLFNEEATLITVEEIDYLFEKADELDTIITLQNKVQLTF